MHRQAFSVMGFREPTLDTIKLSAAERATLERAAAILERLRELREDEDDDLGVDIALAMYVCRDLVAEKAVVI